MKILDIIMMLILIFGGVNWGLVGLADYNVIMYTFIAMHDLQHLIYLIIGFSALWWLVRFWRLIR
jgi:uncharacterized membrane protein YuzA (DUF378 family)